MLRHAQEFLAAARSNTGAGRPAVAFDEARHAAEVAAKALHLKATGTDFGKGHAVAGPLNALGLLPAQVPERKWVRFFQEHTRASYGYFEDFTDAEVHNAITWATVMLQAAESYPDFAFHPPRTD